MRNVRTKILLSFGGICILLFVIFSSLQKPKYSGNEHLPGIAENVDVYFDEVGVPHIYASSKKDAYRALGYVHAQDRLWQMELLRRIAAGRLSELFGKKTKDVDCFFKSLGIEEATEKTIKNLAKDTEHLQLSEAYLGGVNQFINEGTTPIEYHLLGLEKEIFELDDVYNVFGYMAFSFAMAHKTDPLLSELKAKLGMKYLNDLSIDLDTVSTSIQGNAVLASSSTVSASLTTLFKEIPVPLFIGSNSWVLGPKKTTSGQVLFENDPHIGFAQPSVWYQAHIKTPNYENYGFYLALTPFPLLGHNRDYAYGITMFENDDIDFYYEKEHPENSEKYLYKDSVMDFTYVEKNIKIKDAEDVKLRVKTSIHGPILNSVLEMRTSEKPLAMSWIYTRLENKLLQSCYGMSHANSFQEFEDAVRLIHAPGLNIMYGDANGNIAWWAAAKLYNRSNEANPKFVLEGGLGKDDQLEFVDFSENPKAINPEKGYVYSANNQSFALVEKKGSFLKKGYPGYYLPEDRAKRIETILDTKAKFTAKEMEEMALDVTSSTALEFLKYFEFDKIDKASLRSNMQEAVELLLEWEGNFVKESLAATIYSKMVYLFLEKTMKDELGVAHFNQFLNTHLQKRTVHILMSNEASIWWDNITTDGIETREEILKTVFHQAISDLEHQLGDNIADWRWGGVHQLEHKHPMGEVALLRKFFNIGPFEVDGANEVLNNLQCPIDSTGVYSVKGGPSTRRIIDFSNIENSRAILPTGQSGNPFSKHYKDQAEKYVKGIYIPMLLDENQLKKSKDHLVLKAE
jgi:penicillin amidase